MVNHGDKYKATQMDDGLMPRCTPANLAGGEYSTYPANADEKNKKKGNKK